MDQIADVNLAKRPKRGGGGGGGGGGIEDGVTAEFKG